MPRLWLAPLLTLTISPFVLTPHCQSQSPAQVPAVRAILVELFTSQG